ncbi:phosphotransferase enzyme family protein [Oceanobacillus jeddahense]|uniref:phosphotransferase enzyme family protein n=1 Tax=Oceanobacillus jeddahense TaxID=1462527 RepID=UPI0005960365|nr:phosphotransferase [Oceanobacillus jeddahense]
MDPILLEQIKSLYSGIIKSPELLGGFDNNVFLFRDQNMVIKILDTEVYKKTNLLNEQEIINIMLQNGIKTPGLIPSKSGEFIELIKGEEKSFYVMAYSYVDGKVLTPDLKNKHFIKVWGKQLGKMHEITKLNNHEMRQNYLEWDHDIQASDFAKGQGRVIEEKWEKYMEQFSNLSKDKNNYGIVHHDLHNENMIIADKAMYVLDFGDVRKSWYVYDAVIPVFHFMENNRHRSSLEQHQIYHKFTTLFFEGYSEETVLSEDQMNLIPSFLDYRLLYSFLFFVNTFKGRKISPGVRKHLEKMQSRIANNVPFIPV